MYFSNTWAFLFLLSIPTIIAMYLLKQKFEEKQISSIYLWKNALEMTKSEQPWQKLTKNLLLFLQLLAALLFVLSLASPYFLAKNSVSDCILVLDGSLSMQTEDVKTSRFEKAKEEMISFVNNLKPNSTVTLVYDVKQPYIVINNSSEKKVIVDKIKELKATYSENDFEATKNMVDLLNKENNKSVYYFSDKVNDNVSYKNFVFGESVSNMAITNLSYAFEEERLIVLVKIKNFSINKESNSVLLFGDNSLISSENIELEPMEEKDIFFTDVDFNITSIEARLSENDYLKADDSFYEYIEKNSVKKVILFAENNIFLENVLSLFKNIELYKGNIVDISNMKGYYLYVFDGVLPDQVPKDGHLLIINPPVSNKFIETESDITVNSIDSKSSTLLKLIGDFKFDILKSKKIKNPDWGQVVLESDGNPLMISGNYLNQKVVVLGFDLHNTDLPLRKEFPIFINNLMQYYMPQSSVSKNHVVSSDSVEINVLPDAKQVKVVSPDEKTYTLAPPFPIAPFSETNLPGFYTIVENIENDQVYNSFSVNVDTRESDLLKNNDDEKVTVINESTASVNKNLSSLFALILLSLILVEWWVFRRGN